MKLSAIFFIIGSSCFSQTLFSPNTLIYNSFPAPYIASASTTYDVPFAAWNAFSGVGTGSYWLGTNSGVDWLQYQSGDGTTNTLSQYSITIDAPDSITRAPKNWQMQGSLDCSTWSTLDTQTNVIAWIAGQTKTYAVSSSTPYSCWRLNITANNGNTYTDVSALKLYAASANFPVNFAPKNMTSDTAPSPLAASASTEFADAFKAFDGAIGSGNSWVGSGGGTDYVQIFFGSATVYVPMAYTVVGASTSASRSPKSWTFQGSSNGSSWTTLDTETNQTAWATGGAPQARSYTFTTGTAYTFYRLNITANNGDATYTDVNEIYIWKSPAAPTPPESSYAIIH